MITNEIKTSFYCERMKPFNLKNLFLKIIEIEVNEKINAEEFVKEHYSNFKIDKLTNYVDSPLWKILPQKLVKIRYDELAGTPDFLVTPKRDDSEGKIVNFFFVEVKTNGDGLNVVQLEWIRNHPDIPVLVIYVKQKIKK